MRIEKRLPLMILFFCLTGLPVLAAGDVHLLFGQKASSDGRLDNVGVKDQTLLGVMLNLDFHGPVGLAVDLLTSSDDNTRTEDSADPMVFFTETKSIELDLGVRKLFLPERRFKPYVGGGIAWIQLDVLQTVSGSLGTPETEFTDTILDDSDAAFGLWLDGGFLYQWKGGFSLGADLRYSSAEASLSPAGEDGTAVFEAGGAYYGLTVGYAW